MTEPVGSAEKSVFTIDSRGQVSIGQAWVRMRTKSRPDARHVSSQQTGRKAMLSSPEKIGGTSLCNTWQRVSCRRNIAKDISLKGW